MCWFDKCLVKRKEEKVKFWLFFLSIWVLRVVLGTKRAAFYLVSGFITDLLID